MRVYRCGTRDSDRKMAREREKCIYACLLFSTAHFSGYMGLPRYRALFFIIFCPFCLRSIGKIIIPCERQRFCLRNPGVL